MDMSVEDVSTMLIDLGRPSLNPPVGLGPRLYKQRENELGMSVYA